ncbi:hypothetical protein PG993_011315 [Apiospora rasikravindrae]|uniref:Fungal N-terminal domain-containing protein n=1 Tax=Apiospora rasikravindrae TaxID=990691 RepID=A0ABR1SDV9_9PEZI
MEVALTFGSVGDIVAICQIAIHLSRALGVGCAEASGSAKEYQDLRKDLDSFTHILVQIVAKNRQFESYPSVANLNIETRPIVNECATLIRNALDRWFPKYNQSLQPGGSGNSVKDAFRKIEWSLREKQGLRELQEKLRKNTERLALLTGITSRHTARTENASLLANIDEVKIVASENQANQQILQESLQLQSVENQARHSDLGKRLEVQATGVISIVAILIAVFHEVGHVRTLVAAVMSRLRMMTTPLLVQGGCQIGNYVSVPSVCDLANEDTPKDFDTLLEMRFKNRKGHELVRLQLFALEDDCSGKDIDRAIPLNACLRRGMKLNMDFQFEFNGPGGCCPRCGTAVAHEEDKSVRCPKKHCGMWSRTVRNGSAQSSWKQFTWVTCDTPVGNYSAKRMSSADSELPKPSDFQRVRVTDYATSTILYHRILVEFAKDIRRCGEILEQGFKDHRSRPLRD